MFTAKYKDSDSGHRSMPGFFIWQAAQGLAMTQAGLHRRHLEVRKDSEAQTVEQSAGRIGNLHWEKFSSEYERTGYAGFCPQCKSDLCPINRCHICRILILYQLTIKLHMYYPESLYVTDLGIKESDIEIFLAYFVRRNVSNGRFGIITRHTIPTFRDFSESVYSGGTIDITQLVRPNTTEMPNPNQNE